MNKPNIRCCILSWVATLMVVVAPTPPVAAQVASETGALPTDAGLVERFDNWEVRNTPGSKNYFLIGLPADKSGQLWLMCEQKNFLTVAVSMGGKGGRQGFQKSQQVTLRVDDAEPRDFNFLVFESFVALATEVPGTSDNRVTAFLEALRDVKNMLVLTYDQTEHRFDVAQLQLARTRFLKLCGR
ncbi:MAG: hypothetical protein ACXWJW_02090 [Xanthobacteraceae bacterium]